MSGNISALWVLLQTNDSNDGQGCRLAALPARGDTFIFRWIPYRVTDVRHTPEPAVNGGWSHEITLVLEPKQ